VEPENIRFGGGSSVTILHPLVALMMLVAIVLILTLPRKHVIVPFLLTFFCIPKGQVVILAGIHFEMARILILAGLARWKAMSSPAGIAGGFNALDRAVLGCAVSLLVVCSLSWMQLQALVMSVGGLLDTLGCYFFMRYLIRDREDVSTTMKVLAVAAIINGACMIYEQRTGVNVFAFMGGVWPEAIRDGKLRSKGVFEVEVTAAAFGGTLPPLFIWLMSQAKSRVIGFLGLLGTTAVAITCRASTSLLAYGSGILALCLWPLRKKMRPIRWCIVATLVSLHLVMNGPVWSLIEKVDMTGSSSSFHRYMLVDNLIRHFWDWWLLGAHDYGSWGWEMWDTSNQYVAYGLTGGLLTLAFFITIISRSFGRLGIARKRIEGNLREEWFIWCLGATMLAHVVAYFGIAYFDQTQFAWLAFLAIISMTTSTIFEAKRTQPQMILESQQIELAEVAL